ncbi:unnamed protein product [Clonostachys rhizophaga]|uniref:Major facilitator superfamily (MFS) profile domain-containing protein n=1 Tax=Clonostachys rhizophaga TaxID=160324 RepID=A0A9N9V5N4_9HYPO|nr:unnamed protein product [Clonostachys rhizophaga]
MSETFDSRAPTLDSRRSLDAEKQNIEISVEEQPSKGVQSWDPTKLPWARKIHIIVAGFTCTFNCNLGSSMPSGALTAISEHFSVTDKVQLTLLNSLYMLGYVISPLVVGPLCEFIGRRPVLIGTFIGYIVFMLACSGAPSYSALLIFRLLCGFNAAAPTTVINGLYADILDNPSERGSAISFYQAVTTCGPLIGPIISGFSSQLSWRWPFWAAAIIASPGLPIVLTIPETFAPVLQNKDIRRKIKKGLAGPESLEQMHVFNPRKIFVRPFVLLFTEPILLFACLYLTLVYSVFYLMFQAYPILFQRHYGLSPGVAGLAFLPTALGAIVAMAIAGLWTWYYDRSVEAGKPWALREVNRRLPLACMAAPLMVIALFWLGWTAWDFVSPVLPAFSGFFFGLGFQLVFIGMSNYINDVFRELSASAQAAAGTTRSIGAVLLPLAAGPMYDSLGIHWAPSLLGFIALVMGVIPFAFIRYGDILAAKSKSARDIYGYSSS